MSVVANLPITAVEGHYRKTRLHSYADGGTDFQMAPGPVFGKVWLQIRTEMSF